MHIDNKYKLGDPVYLVTDPQQLKRIVIGILVREQGGLMYHVSYVNEAQYCYDCELSGIEDIILKTT